MREFKMDPARTRAERQNEQVVGRYDMSIANYVVIRLLSYYIVLYCIVLYCIVLYCIVLYCIVLYCIVLYCIVLYCIVLYCIILYYIILYYIILYYIILYYYSIFNVTTCIKKCVRHPRQTDFASARQPQTSSYEGG